MSENTKKKIIILDDDKFLVNMYVTKFDKAGVDVDATDSGEEVIKKIKEGSKPDLLLLDIIIPGMSGLETLETLRKENLMEGVKVVMLSNQSNPEDLEKAKTLKIDGYIIKATATPTEVVDRVLKIMNQ